MPYEVIFSKAINVSDDEQYFNECCVGGDLIVDLLLPEIEKRYESVRSNQEDWGWFIWFKKGKVSIAIDIFTEDASIARFRVQLTSRIKKWLIFDRVCDDEQDALLELVLSRLESRAEGSCKVVRLNERFEPLDQ